MRYHSTRNKDFFVDSAEAIIQGITPDGGLFVPENLPKINIDEVLESSSLQMQTKILSAFLPEIPDMKNLVDKAYIGKFETKELTPTVKVGENHVLELFHGPTYAFKDVALCMLPQLLTAAIKSKGQDQEVRILTATSGDTGKAALAGFQDVEKISICVFFPHQGVSEIQKKQMTSQEGNNVKVAAVKGNFDDIQSSVKKIFITNKNINKSFKLSSANSINIGRLTPQIMYYFKAYKDLIDDGTIKQGQEVNFSVPTGNFGDILAGYIAKELGLPIKKLICASNANKVLTDFIETGVYNKARPLVKTTSPSMDILISSNLERLLYFLSNDTTVVDGLMKDLDTQGEYKISSSLHEQIKEIMHGEFCDNTQTKNTIANVFKEHNYLMDPHTSCGWYAAEKYKESTGDKTPMIVLSTASPYKFPAAVLSAIDAESNQNGYEQMATLQKLSGVPIPNNLANLKDKPELHKNVINVEQMQEFSLS